MPKNKKQNNINNQQKNIKQKIEDLYNELQKKFTANNVEEVIKSFLSPTLTDPSFLHEFMSYVDKIKNLPEQYQLAQLLIESMTKFKDLPKIRTEGKDPQVLINQFAKAFSIEVIRSHNIDITNIYCNLKENLDEGNLENAINSYIFLSYSNSKIFQGISSYINANANLPEHQKTASLLNTAFNKFKEFAAKEPDIIIPTEIIKRFAKEFSAEFVHSKSSAIYKDIMNEFKEGNLENAFSIYFMLSFTNSTQFQQLNYYIDNIKQTPDDKKLSSLLSEANTRLIEMIRSSNNINTNSVNETNQKPYTILIQQLAEEFSKKFNTYTENKELDYDICFQKELEAITSYIRNDEIDKAHSFFNDLKTNYTQKEELIEKILESIYKNAKSATNDDFTRLKLYELILNLTSAPSRILIATDMNDQQAENEFMESSRVFFQQYLNLHQEIFSFIQESSVNAEHKTRTIYLLQHIFCENEKIYQSINYSFNHSNKKTLSAFSESILIKELQNEILEYLSSLEPTFNINYPIFNLSTGEHTDQHWPLKLAIRVNNQNIEKLNHSLAILLSNQKEIQVDNTSPILEEEEITNESEEPSFHSRNTTYEMFIDNHVDDIEVLLKLRDFFNKKITTSDHSETEIEYNRLTLHTQSYINKHFLINLLAENPQPSFETSNDLFCELEETQKLFERILSSPSLTSSHNADDSSQVAEYKNLLNRMFEQAEITYQILTNNITNKIVEESTYFTLMKNLISTEQQILAFMKENYPSDGLNSPIIDNSSIDANYLEIKDNILPIEDIFNRNSPLAVKLMQRISTILDETNPHHREKLCILSANMDKIHQYYLTDTNHDLLNLLVEKNTEFLSTSNLPRFSLIVNSQLLDLKYTSMLNNTNIQSLNYKTYFNTHKEELKSFSKELEMNVHYLISHSNQLIKGKYDAPQRQHNIALSIRTFEMFENIYTILASSIDIASPNNLKARPKFTPQTAETLHEMKGILSNMDIILKNILKLDGKLIETYSLPSSIQLQNSHYKKEQHVSRDCSIITRPISELQKDLQKAQTSITTLSETLEKEGNKKITAPKFFESWQKRILEQQTLRLKNINISR